MKAFQLNDTHAHPSKIQVTRDAAEPKCGANELTVDVYAAGLNFFDILQAQGKYQNQPPFPFILGAEFAGKVSANSTIPAGCPFKAGDRVFGQAQGCYAERVAADWHNMHPVPKGMSFDEASGLYVTWPTSYEALVGRAAVQPGEWVLVHAGAGGVGLAAVQLAKVLGAKVIATASTPAKLAICKSGGADFTVDYTKPGWQKEVLSITGGKGADVVYDPVGLIKDSLKCIAWKGRAIVVGFAAGQIEKLPLNLVLLKNISIVGLHWGAYQKFEKTRVPEVWAALFEIWELGKAKPIVYSEVFRGIESVSKGLGMLERRETWGKAVVRIRDDDNIAAKL